MKKKEIKQEPVKLSVADFPLKMDCQVSLEEYQNYAIWSSEEERTKVKRRTIATSIIFCLAGLLLIYRGINSTWVYHDWLTILGVMAIGYGVLDVFYQFVLFRTALKRHMAKEYAKDPRFSREVTFCFAEDRMVSFHKEAHQGTFYYDEVLKKEEHAGVVLLTLRNGKILVFPKRVVDQADPEIQNIIARLGA